MQHITDAGAKLDHSKDADWTEGGRPSLKRVQALAKDNTITQAQVDEYLSALKREKPPEVDKNVQQVALVDRATKPAEPGKPVEAVRMVAIERGYYGGVIRDPGDSFVFTGRPGSWMREETTEEATERKRLEKHMAEKGSPRDDAWAAEISKATK